MGEQANIGFVCKTAAHKGLYLPLFLTRIPAGFPAPVEDYIEEGIDLNRKLIRHPPTTFYVKVIGDSMRNIGIFPDSMLVVDRTETAKNGDIIIARIGDELCVKRFSRSDDGRIWLLSENELYTPIEVKPEDDFEIWGA